MATFLIKVAKVIEEENKPMRCKVACSSKVALGNEGYALSFYAVYGGSEENDKYFKATPSASFVMQTVNAAAAAKFEVGKYYYVDFFSAE
jgi:hypothetical protein